MRHTGGVLHRAMHMQRSGMAKRGERSGQEGVYMHFSPARWRKRGKLYASMNSDWPTLHLLLNEAQPLKGLAPCMTSWTTTFSALYGMG